MINLGAAGWDGFSGEMETGFSNLVEAVGATMKLVAGASGEVDVACKTFARTLEDIETESDALLLTAREQLAELDALGGEAHEWSTKLYWRRRALQAATDTRAEDPDAYENALDRVLSAERAIHWIGVASSQKRGELNESQVKFDQLRELEDLAQSDLAAALSPVHDTLSRNELNFSSADLRGVDMVFDIFDIAYLSIGALPRSLPFGRDALLAARSQLADVVGIDLAERDLAITQVLARRELEAMGPDGYEDALREAVVNGDINAMRELAELLANGLAGMSPEEAQAYRDFVEHIGEQLPLFARGFDNFFLFFLGAATPAPPWIVDIIINNEGQLAEIYYGEWRDAFARQFGLDRDDYDLGDQILAKIYERFIDDHGYEFVTALLQSDGGNPVGAAVALEFLVTNPGQLSDLVNGDSDKLQDVLEVLGKNQISDENWRNLVEVYAGDYPLADKLNDPNLSAGDVWQLFGADIANLQKQIEEIGGPGYEWNGIAKFVLLQGVKMAPGGAVVSPALSAFMEGIEGYEADDTYELLAEEDAADLDRQALVLGVMLEADPSLVDQVEAEMSAARQQIESTAAAAGEEPDLSSPAVLKKMIQMNGSAAHRIEVNANLIESSFLTAVDGN